LTTLSEFAPTVDDFPQGQADLLGNQQQGPVFLQNSGGIASDDD
jgi:hypothetical protein